MADYQALANKTPNMKDYMSLFEFGFTDFLVNEHLLSKYQHVDMVAEILMTGQVSDETIKEIYAKARQERK